MFKITLCISPFNDRESVQFKFIRQLYLAERETVDMKMRKILLFITLFCLTPNGFSQVEKDSIILINGHVYRGTITNAAGDFISFKEEDRKGNTFTSQIESYRIFSYTQSGQTTTVYTPNEIGGDFLTVDEARKATLGSYDARQTFKPRFVFWSSLAIGYGASLYDTYLLQKTVDHEQYQGDYTSSGFFKSRPSFFPFLAPAVLSVSWSIPSFKVKKKQMIQVDLLNDESYYRGYHRIARQKRIFAALKGSFIGIGTGMLTYAFLKP